ncbi:HD domain-containing protein [Nonomuraea sp. CA-143628]|uniref:HD domain-containing protein n=1 Tax=Nonomuraea sp. CA-143628 TaxID=3239997 RepID=UPI003D94A84F
MTGLLESLLARLPAESTAVERGRIQRAYEFAARCHTGQVRKSGDPYITHPVAVAEIAIDAGLDCATVCAALLHDVIEDTGCDAAQLRAEFGDEIATLVQSVTELDHRPDEAAIDAADSRVLALKVLDRLHNMRTIQHLDQEKQRQKSEQTLDIMAPLAGHLGLRAVADELESIARGRLTHLLGDTGATYQVLVLGSLLLPAAVRASYVDEWLGELDVLRDRRARTRFALRLALSMPALALTLRRPKWHTSAGHLLSVLRWILRTDLRTWTPLTVLLGWMIVETARNSLSFAVIILITVPPALHAGVTRLRTKLGLDQPDEPT